MSTSKLPELDTDDSAIVTVASEGASPEQKSGCADLEFTVPLDENCDQLTLSGDSGEAPESTLMAARDALAQRPSSHDQPATTLNKERRLFDLSSISLQIHLEVWRLAWPSVITMLMQTANSLMDVFFVGHLPNGAHALAATGIGGSVNFLLISLAMGVSVGTTALVARFKGAQDKEGGIQATGQSLTLSMLCAIVFGTLFYFGRTALIGLLLDAKHNPEAAQMCSDFLAIALTAAIPLFLMNVLMGAFRGLGDTRTPMRITLATIATHISLNSVLIYGRLGFPRMGVRGAATAFAASLFVGLILYIFQLYRSPLGEALKYEHLRFKADWAWRILRIGLPAAGQAVIRQLGMMWFTGLLARTVEATASVAALQIGIRAESIAFMPGFGYSVAAAALVGQALGAKDPERAERSAWAAAYQAVLVMSIMAVVFFVFAHQLTSTFTSDSAVMLLGTDYLRLNAICEPFLALAMVLTGALQGAGDTVRPTYITLATMWLVRLPLGYLLMFTLHMNSHGAWIAMSGTTVLGGLMTVALFRAGTWKRIRV